MTPLILYTSEDGQAQVQRKATGKESLTVQTKGVCETSGPAGADHFRGLTKMLGLVNHRTASP